MRWLLIGLAVAYRLTACSAPMCLGSGPEFRNTFQVVVRFDGKPIAGAQVKVSRNGAAQLLGVTGRDGIAVFQGLAAGEYWMEVSHYEISAASHCFHIAARPSLRAKGRVRYEWGDYPVWTRGVDGVIVDSQAGTGGTPLENQLRRNRLPIRGATVLLIDPRRGELRRTVSDDKGAYAFASGVPAGKYVLHVEGGESNRPFDSVDRLLAVGPGSTGAGLVIERRDAGAGACGGTVIDVRSR